jgi:hypothetical protein
MRIHPHTAKRAPAAFFASFPFRIRPLVGHATAAPIIGQPHAPPARAQSTRRQTAADLLGDASRIYISIDIFNL